MASRDRGNDIREREEVLVVTPGVDDVHTPVTSDQSSFVHRQVWVCFTQKPFNMFCTR